MIVRHFDVKPPKAQPPQKERWGKPPYGFWGYHMMAKCFSQEGMTWRLERDHAERAKGQMNEGEFQQDCFLSVLSDIKREHVNMFELGAGWGRLCLALAGIIDYGVIPIAPKSYHCLAVEGDPTHYQWAKEHFEIHNINGVVVHGAVSDKNGTIRFRVDTDPADCYGQSIDPLNSHKFPRIEILRRLISSRQVPSMESLRSIITKRGNIIEIPTYTVDYLMQTYGFDHVDILQMDVQGAEYKVMLGATESVKSDLIDYLLINVHRREFNDALRGLLSPKFDLIVDIYRDSVGTVDGFPPIRCHDGIQLYKRKNI